MEEVGTLDEDRATARVVIVFGALRNFKSEAREHPLRKKCRILVLFENLLDYLTLLSSPSPHLDYPLKYPLHWFKHRSGNSLDFLEGDQNFWTWFVVAPIRKNVKFNGAEVDEAAAHHLHLIGLREWGRVFGQRLLYKERLLVRYFGRAVGRVGVEPGFNFVDDLGLVEGPFFKKPLLLEAAWKVLR